MKTKLPYSLFFLLPLLLFAALQVFDRVPIASVRNQPEAALSAAPQLLSLASNPIAPEAIQILVGPSNELRIIVPHVAKADLVNVVNAFFIRGDETQKTNFNNVIGRASELTFVITTKTTAK